MTTSRTLLLGALAMLLVAAKPYVQGRRTYEGGHIQSKSGVDIQKLLERPGVRWVVVQFHDNDSPKSVAQVPEWKKLVEDFRPHGLHVVVVTGLHRDFDRDQFRYIACEHPGWDADQFSCDEIGFVAGGLGVEERPAAFLWTWPGRILVQQGDVHQIRASLARDLRDHPNFVKRGSFAKVQMPTYDFSNPHEKALQESRDNLAKVTEPGSERLVEFARKWIGTPYEMYGASEHGIDDYNLVRDCYKEVYGIEVGATRREQLRTNPDVPVDLADVEATLRPGDLIGWVVHAGQIPRRVGVYLGNKMYLWVYMVAGARVSPLPEYTWESYWLVARRPLANPDNYPKGAAPVAAVTPNYVVGRGAAATIDPAAAAAIAPTRDETSKWDDEEDEW